MKRACHARAHAASVSLLAWCHTNPPAGQALQGGFAKLELPPAEKKPRAHGWHVTPPKPGLQPGGVVWRLVD